MINVMDEYYSFSKKCFNNYLKLIMGNKYDKTISETFFETYFDIRYSNYLDENTVRFSVGKKISKGLDMAMDSLSSNEKKEVVKATRHYYEYFYDLDQLYLLEAQKKTVNDIYQDRCKMFGVEDSSFVNEFNNMLREDIKKRKDFFNTFESDTFYLEYTDFMKNKNQLRVELNNKIKFPELYSETAIQRVKEKDSVSEDLTIISFLQLSSKIISDLIACDFEKQYYIDLPGTFFDKKTKLARIMNIIDNIYIQDKVKLIISFSCFKRYKTYVMELMRNGFIFALDLDDSFDYCSENLEYLEIFDKIFIKSSKYYYKDMTKNVKINKSIVKVDEVK